MKAHICQYVGEWLCGASPGDVLSDTSTHLGYRSQKDGNLYLLPREKTQDMFTWFNTESERDTLLRSRHLSLGMLADILHYPDIRAQWFGGPSHV